MRSMTRSLDPPSIFLLFGWCGYSSNPSPPHPPGAGRPVQHSSPRTPGTGGPRGTAHRVRNRRSSARRANVGTDDFCPRLTDHPGSLAVALDRSRTGPYAARAEGENRTRMEARGRESAAPAVEAELLGRASGRLDGTKRDRRERGAFVGRRGSGRTGPRHQQAGRRSPRGP